MTISSLLKTFVFAVAVVACSGPLTAQIAKERFSGFAINMNSGPSTATIDFTIERWSTDAERELLLGLIAKQQEHDDPDPILRALQKMPRVGGIRTPQTLAWDLRYAHESPLDEGGRRIVLATDRPMNFREVRNSARTMDYPFTIIEIRLDKDDKGEGKIFAGTKIFVDKNKHITLENYGQQPIRFNQIHKQK